MVVALFGHSDRMGSRARLLRLTLLGVGAMSSPRYAPAGMLARFGGVSVAFDGGPGAEPPIGIDAWLVTDEQAELRTVLRRLASERGVASLMGGYEAGGLTIQPLPVVHTNHPTVGYRVSAGRCIAVWAPEFWQFPTWAAGADLMFADAAGWNRPIRFPGGVGGHADVLQTAAHAADAGIHRLVYAHIGRPAIRAIDAGLNPPNGEWGVEGHTYQVRVADDSRP
jgi:hypothetical protein